MRINDNNNNKVQAFKNLDMLINTFNRKRKMAKPKHLSPVFSNPIPHEVNNSDENASVFKYSKKFVKKN